MIVILQGLPAGQIKRLQTIHEFCPATMYMSRTKKYRIHISCHFKVYIGVGLVHYRIMFKMIVALISQ